MLRSSVVALLFVLASLVTSGCTEDEGEPADATVAAPTGTTTTEVLSTASAPTPEGTQAPTVIPLVDGPPPLEVDGVFLGLGNYCWATAGADEVCDEQDGVVTSTAGVKTPPAESINVTGFGQYDPVEAIAQLWTRPESGESQGANRTIWQRAGAPIEVPVTPGTDAIAVTIDAAPGSYLLDLTVTYEEGAVEYGLQVDVE